MIRKGFCALEWISLYELCQIFILFSFLKVMILYLSLLDDAVEHIWNYASLFELSYHQIDMLFHEILIESRQNVVELNEMFSIRKYFALLEYVQKRFCFWYVHPFIYFFLTIFKEIDQFLLRCLSFLRLLCRNMAVFLFLMFGVMMSLMIVEVLMMVMVMTIFLMLMMMFVTKYVQNDDSQCYQRKFHLLIYFFISISHKIPQGHQKQTINKKKSKISSVFSSNSSLNPFQTLQLQYQLLSVKLLQFCIQIILTIMDDRNFKLAEELVNPTYIRLAQNSLNRREKMMRELLSQRQIPEEPVDDLTIRYILDSIALMDSNNFHGKIGVGERESRIFSRLVQERHFHMGHGIGRSGDVTANQPKAAGSSLLLQLARYLTISALNQLNYQFVDNVLLLPLATGMAISLALLTLAENQPQRKYVLWSRIDHKTCLKAIMTANLIPICIELEHKGDFLCTDIEAFQKKIKQIGPEKILAIASTTSCFAPRVPDRVQELSILAKKYGLFHVVNNAYGIWCSKIANSIKQGMRQGECTAVIQSTDKNFMVPVGGAFIFAQRPQLLEKISSKYPGRASGSPIVDLFITLLSMGKSTIRELRKERKGCFELMGKLAQQTAAKYKCRVLQSPTNTISMALHLNIEGIDQKQLTELGSILYSKRVMGHRIVVTSNKQNKIGQLYFSNYNSHAQNYEHLPYITFASAVGTKSEQLRQFFSRLDESIIELRKKISKQMNKKQKIISKTNASITNEQAKIQQKQEQQQQIKPPSQKIYNEE